MIDPPGDFTSTSRVPPAIENRLRPLRIWSTEERRLTVSDLAFTASYGRKAIVGSARKQFEVGQVLDFVTGVAAALNPMLVSTMEVRHDTNIFDYAAIGLSNSDTDRMMSSATKRLDELRAALNISQTARLSAEVKISEVKKAQNETQKALNAVKQLVLIDPSFQPIVGQLTSKLTALGIEYQQWIDSANSAARDATALRDQILALSQVVR